MAGMAETKGELGKEVRCHHILINPYLGGGGGVVMERRIDIGLGAIHVCKCVTYGLSLPVILLALLDTHTIVNVWWDEIFSLLELSPMRTVGVSCAGYISIPGR